MSASYLYVNYHPASVDIPVQAVRGVKNFQARDLATGNRNVASSGSAVETVNESKVVMVSFTIEGMIVGSGGDFDAWAAFAAWSLDGGTFSLYPSYTRSSKSYFAVNEDEEFVPRWVGLYRYSADFHFRLLAGQTSPASPANALEVKKSFWGQV